MTIGTFHVTNVLKTYTRVMRNTLTRGRAGRENTEVQDVVSISTEGKKKQVRDTTTREIIEKVKDTK